MIGKTVSHYAILEKLGSGGMGVVYKARDLRLDRFVALKFLPDDLASDRRARERFQREAMAVAALDHPNICTVYDVGEYEGRPFFAMQLLEGQTLKDRILGSPLTSQEIIDYGIQISEGLDKAHSKGVIHRDIKPANIFVTADGHVKLLDFGLAKAEATSEANAVSQTVKDEYLTHPGAVVGTIAYMSPEQAHGEQIDARSDLFSFGAVLYEMATGHVAFGGKTNASIFDAILHHEPVSPLRLNPQLLPRLDDIILKALEKDRQVRYQSAAEVRADLKRLRRDSESSAVRSAPIDGGSRHSRRHKWVALVLATLTLAAIAGAVVFGTRRPANEAAIPNDRRLTQLFSSSQEIVDPSLSPDGKTVVYAEFDQGQWDLFVNRTSGGARVRVTNDSAIEAQPRFSPDGERILFTRLLPGSETPDICVTSTFGGDVTPLISGGRSGVWSPDGSRFAFISRPAGRPPALAIADINGGNVQTLLATDPTYIAFEQLDWSPDGSQIAVVRSMGGVSGEIWTVSPSGGAPKRIWKDPPEVYSHGPVFTPDGRALVHSSNRAGAANLWLLFLDGAAPTRLTTGTGPDESPSVARDGTITFRNTKSRNGLFIYDSQAARNQELTTHSTFLWAPAFAPDGDEIAFSRAEADGSWHIWLVPAAGGTPRRLTAGSVPEIYPRFTPDGKSVIYSTWSAQPDRIWKVARTGGAPMPLTPARDDDDAYADISPDGRWLAFARTEGNLTRVYVAPVDGGEARLLTRTPSTVPRWSPDGRYIAFSPYRPPDGGIYIIGADGSGERQLTKTGSWPVWTPDGSRIAYWALGPDGNQQVRTVSVSGGAAVTMPGLRFNGTNFPFDLLGKNLLVSTNNVHLSTEIWMSTLSPSGR